MPCTKSYLVLLDYVLVFSINLILQREEANIIFKNLELTCGIY